MSIENARWENGAAEFALRTNASPGARIEVALAIDATHQEVSRGENAGRTLRHVAVVRVMKEFGSNAADGRELRVSGGPLAKKDESLGPVRLVVFLVDPKTARVVGAAEQTLKR